MNKFLLLFLVFCSLLFSPTAKAQSISIDSVDGLTFDGKLDINAASITFYIRITNDSVNHTGITNGFQIYSEDGAEWGQTIPDTLPLGWRNWFDLIFEINTFSLDGVGADTVGFGGASLFQSGIPADFDELAYTLTIGPFGFQNAGKSIVIDKSFYPPIGSWKWAGPDATPDWGGPYSYQFNGIIESVNLAVSPETLVVDVYDSNLLFVTDSVQVYAWGISGSADFSLTENIDWLALSPLSGGTPEYIQLTITVPSETKFDSVLVSSSTATNAPIYFYVKVIPHFATDNNSGSIELPESFTLYQNYPNPFNPSTEIKFDIPRLSIVTFNVYNVYGQTVYRAVEEYNAGSHSILFDGSGLPSGIYFYRIISEEYDESKKMILIK